MSFASREKALLSQWEVGVGLVPAEAPWRDCRASSAEDAPWKSSSAQTTSEASAERLGYVNRALPDGELDAFVDALARRIASFDKWAIANTKRLVNAASLPPDVEIAAGWDTCMASFVRPVRPGENQTVNGGRFHKPGDAEKRLGYYVGQLGLNGRALKPKRPISLSERKHTTMDLLTTAKNIADRAEAESAQTKRARRGDRHRHSRQRRSHPPHVRSAGVLPRPRRAKSVHVRPRRHAHC